jgi:hypothetical protein
MPKGAHLKWRGPQAGQAVLEQVVVPAMTEFGLEAEAESKKELRKGHGVLTGTARRSIHTAEPGYDWGQDDVEPSGGAPERGGRKARARILKVRVTIQLGSGLKYALPLHQGHHGFKGYHFLTNGVRKAKARLPKILAKYRIK